ncbi:MAG: acyl-CoA dehydratase activase [Longimicrobiales bacterium]|nr:acyl-CoA dehydratase activase [Longimicrobiales bacterium]
MSEPGTRQDLGVPSGRDGSAEPLSLGIDVGSTTVKVVLLSPDGSLLASRYVRAAGRPRETVLTTARALLEPFSGASVESLGLSGSGGGPVAEILGGLHVNELVAQTRAVGVYHPEARTVIEIGGQDSKLLSVRYREGDGSMVLEDFAMNALCAAGTGSFLDQQAERLGIDIDGEFERIALSSETPARVAGRCTVFAKSDMIHLQQEGTPLSDILAGLCLALARNFITVIGKAKPFVEPILFQGGVAHNRAVVRAFEEVLGLEVGSLVVLRHHDFMAAIGSALVARDQPHGKGRAFAGLDALEAALRSGFSEAGLPPLRTPRAPACHPPSITPRGTSPTRVYVGVDVGSVSTNAVVIDDDDRLLARSYLPTAGKPLEAVRKALGAVGGEVGDDVEVLAAGVTGSGRYLTGHYLGADSVRNEITAQARAAVALDPDVDTVFEIGGQDSKFIRIDHGVVVDFAMNNACAAGTGSFLEEQADRLGIRIRGDFARIALTAPAPASLGERCTVFMESDLIHHQQRGASVEDLTAGLAYSIVENYLNRVVNGRPIGRKISFQGGVASNDAVVAAFEAVTERPVTVPADHDVTGAIGAAMLAREERSPDGATRFRGFDLSDRRYSAESFLCRACPNLCEVKRVAIENEPPVFYGARCDRFEEAGRGRKALDDVPDLFAERMDALLGGWEDPGDRTPDRVRVGIPRTLIFYELFPWWHAFFRHLDMDIVLSAETNAPIVARTQQRAAAETCFPVKLVFGHVLQLLERDVDYVFLPSILDRERPAPGQRHSHYCPLIPAAGRMVPAHVDVEVAGARTIQFPLHMSEPQARRRELGVLARSLGVPTSRALVAAEEGDAAQAAFEAWLKTRGRQVIDSLGDRPSAVLVGRPYNTCDEGACHDLPRKLRRMGVLPIPVDFLRGCDVDISDVHRDMFWHNGQSILGAGRTIAADPRLQAIYVTNFHCGPDAFLLTYFRQMMGGRPFLELEMDDHTAEAGIVTRCEAFFDSLRSVAPEAA